MCGLFCGIGKLSSNRMIALGSLSEERGLDSVGLAYLINKEMQIAKIAQRASVGLNITLRKAVTEAAVSGLFIGHTRQATQGEVNSRNAHPFLTDGIAFAHNGIILNDQDFGKYEVDSESLIHGIKDKDFSKYDGAIALVWIEDGKLNAYRCGNPLFRGRHNGGTYLASEGDYLKEIGCTHVKELSEGMIYTFVSPYGITTQKVNKNKTYGSKYGWSKKSGWEDYQSILDVPLKPCYTPPPLIAEAQTIQSYREKKAEMQIQEDFRTPRDIVKDMTSLGMVSSCECCGNTAELDGGYCLDCITWLDSNGTNHDIPPSWLSQR